MSDLRNLLDAALTRSRLALETPEPLRSDIVDIRETIHRAAALLAEIESKPRPARETCSLDELFSDLVPILGWLAGESVTLKLVSRVSGLVVGLPRLDLERILESVILNARESMSRDGFITIDVSCRVARGSGIGVARRSPSTVRIEIHDSGDGIEPALLPRIFDRHFTTKGDPARGIGLADVKETVENAGGNVSMTSCVGAGSSFLIELPRIDG